MNTENYLNTKSIGLAIMIISYATSVRFQCMFFRSVCECYAINPDNFDRSLNLVMFLFAMIEIPIILSFAIPMLIKSATPEVLLSSSFFVAAMSVAVSGLSLFASSVADGISRNKAFSKGSFLVYLFGSSVELGIGLLFILFMLCVYQ